MLPDHGAAPGSAMVVPARRVKTEYMKRFKEPKWESCGACYLELLHYRLSRRLLEQAHRPWLWDGWEQDSGSGGGSTAGSPSPPGAGSPAAAREEEEAAAGAAAPSEAGRASPGRERGGGGGDTRVSGAGRAPAPRRGRAALPFPVGLGTGGSARAALPRLGGPSPILGAPGPGRVTVRGRRPQPGPSNPPPGHGPGVEGPISRAPLPPAGSWLGLRGSHGCGIGGVPLKSQVVVTLILSHSHLCKLLPWEPSISAII